VGTWDGRSPRESRFRELLIVRHPRVEIRNLTPIGGALSHMVGMAVHDVGTYRDGIKPGHVFSIDPQLRVPEEHLYLRYEDKEVREVLDAGLGGDDRCQWSSTRWRRSSVRLASCRNSPPARRRTRCARNDRRSAVED
jgi:hypothetical protein